MATLPNTESIGPIDTQQTRRMGVGGWNPTIIGRAYGEEAQGLDKLGAGLSNFGEDAQRTQDAMQLAQAHGQYYTQAGQAMLAAQQTNDPNQLTAIQKTIPDMVSNAGSLIQNPVMRQQFLSQAQEHANQIDLHLAGRALDLTHQNAIAGFQTTANQTIDNAAQLNDETASAQMMDGVKAQIKALGASGTLNPEQQVQAAQQAADRYTSARWNYKLARAETTRDPNDYAALYTFAGLDPTMAGLAKDQKTGSWGWAPGQGPATVTAPTGGTSGSVPAGAPPGTLYTAKSAAGETQYIDKNGNVIQPAAAQTTPPSTTQAPAFAPVVQQKQPAGPSSYPALGGGITAPEQAAPPASNSSSSAAQLLSHYEGFRQNAYWDVNHWRVGFGSDTVTDANGNVHPVTQGTVVSQDDANRDLARRVRETQTGIAASVGEAAWGRLSPGAQAAATSMAYNYGTLPLDVQAAIRGGTTADVAQAIANHAGDNGGVNAQRRLGEAQIANGGAVPQGLYGVYGARPLSFRDLSPLAPIGLPPAPAEFDSMVTPAAFTGGAGSQPIPSMAPARSEWPAGAQSVEVSPTDGSFNYKMQDGSMRPVPGYGAMGMPWRTLPPPAPGSLAASLPADRRAELQVRAINEVRRLQRQDMISSQRDNRQDLDTILNSVKQMETGSQLIKDEQGWEKMRDAYANSPDPNTRQNFAVADAVRNNLGRLWGVPVNEVMTDLAQRRAEFDRMVAANPNDPRLFLPQSVVQSEELYAKNLTAEAKVDPLGRVAREGLINLKPLDPTSPTFSQDVADRAMQAKVAGRFLGQDPQFFQPQEKVLARNISAAGGDPMIRFAQGIVQGGGRDAAQMFKQVGGDAPALMTIGQLSLMEGDHTSTINRIAQYIAASRDPQASKSLPVFNEGTLNKNAGVDPLDAGENGSVYSGFGTDATARVRTAAHYLMGQAASDTGKSPDRGDKFDQPFFDKAYNEALGATYDQDKNQFGGVAKVGGGWGFMSGPGYQTVAPTDVRADKLGTILGQITNDDIAKMPSKPEVDGKPIDATIIRSGQFVAVPDQADGLFRGKYQVLTPDSKGNPVPILNQNGQPWIFDMNRVEDRMRNVVPDGFLPRTPGESQTQPSYRRTPGMTPEPEPGTTLNEGGGNL